MTPNTAIHLSRHLMGILFAEHTLRPGDGERSKDRETRARMLTAGLVVLNFSYWRSTPRKL